MVEFGSKRYATGESKKYTRKFHHLPFIKDSGHVINTWYTFLDEVDVDELLWWHYEQHNDESANKNIELQATIDGELWEGGWNGQPDNAQAYVGFTNPLITDYFPNNPPLNITTIFTMAGVMHRDSGDTRTAMDAFYGGHSVKLEYRITSAIGGNQRMRADITYRKVEESV